MSIRVKIVLQFLYREYRQK